MDLKCLSNSLMRQTQNLWLSKQLLWWQIYWQNKLNMSQVCWESKDRMFLVISLGGMVYVSFCDYSTSIIILYVLFYSHKISDFFPPPCHQENQIWSIYFFYWCSEPTLWRSCGLSYLLLNPIFHLTVTGEKVEELYFVVHKFKLPY